MSDQISYCSAGAACGPAQGVRSMRKKRSTPPRSLSYLAGLRRLVLPLQAPAACFAQGGRSNDQEG